jgi:DNA-binding NarL/FixJ family response regulator
LLGEEEQALLRRLAAFPGGFDLAAVEAACRGHGSALPPVDLQPLAALARLVDQSLVERRGGSATEPRYSQLVTVRGFLRERLAAAGEADAADRLTATFVAAVARSVGMFGLSREELDRLERELNNFRATLELLVRTDPAAAVDLAVDLFGFWRTRRVREGREWIERTLSAAEPKLPAAARSRGLWAAAALAVLQSDFPAVQRLAPASVEAAREAGDRKLLGRALVMTAIAALSSADHAAGAARLRESLALGEEIGDIPVLAASSNILGELARRDGDADAALTFFERSYAFWREIGDVAGVANGAHNLGQMMLERGDLERAGGLLLEALAKSNEVGSRHSRALVLATATTIAVRHAPRAPVATLLGAAEAELEAAGAVLDVLEEQAFRETETSLRTALGADEFAAAQARGRTLRDAEQQRLVERLLTSPSAAVPGPLTQRELDVIRLVAAGLTNTEIADRLVLSKHTVHRHVANILRKLNARSRAAAASHAAQAGLL